jgi:predicted transcriptional regulator
MYAALHSILLKSRGIALAQLQDKHLVRQKCLKSVRLCVSKKGEDYMLIKEIMETGVAECTEDASLRDVYELIQQSPNGYVVVIDSKQHRVPIGIVDEHSICENIVRRSRDTKSLDAGNVMNTNIRRVRENAVITEYDKARNGAAIMVVNERRQFLGTIDAELFERSLDASRRAERAAAIPIGNYGPQMQPAVELPAFGWLK